MGYAEFHTADGWVNVEDMPIIDTVNCQLCNEPTLASDITITARIVDAVDVFDISFIHWRSCNGVHGWDESLANIESTEVSRQNA